MSNTLKWVLGTVGVLVIGAALVWGGIGIGWTMYGIAEWSRTTRTAPTARSRSKAR